MEERLPFLRSSALFRGMTDGEILRVLECLHAREQRFDQDQILWDAGGQPVWALVLEGGLMLQQEDLRGNRSILGDFGPGDFMGGNAMGAIAGSFFVSVRAGTSLLLMDREGAMDPCGECCRAHMLFLRNAAEGLARRELLLLYKVEYLSKRTTREKLLSYLAIQSSLQGTRRVNVPYTRQELADFLAVDRSAMCTELTRMQNDGLIRFERKRFELLEK
jgi:CRP-like cAMP-binding protein